MNENELFVDNPLALSSLYGEGIYIVNERISLQESDTVGLSDILVFLHYPEKAEIPPRALEILNNMMNALRWNGRQISSNDFKVINSGRLKDGVGLSEILVQVNPKKMLLFADNWPFNTPEVPYYQPGRVENVEMLKCHSLRSIFSDNERKKASWTAIRAFFSS